RRAFGEAVAADAVAVLRFRLVVGRGADVHAAGDLALGDRDQAIDLVVVGRVHGVFHGGGAGEVPRRRLDELVSDAVDGHFGRHAAGAARRQVPLPPVI